MLRECLGHATFLSTQFYVDFYHPGVSFAAITEAQMKKYIEFRSQVPAVPSPGVDATFLKTSRDVARQRQLCYSVSMRPT